MSPSSSGPPTPSHSATHLVPGNTESNTTGTSPMSPKPNQSKSSSNPYLPMPLTSGGLATSIPASALPGARLSGRLLGVVSLTDILNLQARASGLSPANPSDSRSHRRRSSSCSTTNTNLRWSGEMGRELFSRHWIFLFFFVFSCFASQILHDKAMISLTVKVARESTRLHIRDKIIQNVGKAVVWSSQTMQSG